MLRRPWMLLSLCLVAGALAPRVAQACDCGEISLEDAIASADQVFAGRFVRSIPHVTRPHGRRFRVAEVVVRVERAWKGARVGQEVSLWQTLDDCDIGPAPRFRGSAIFFVTLVPRAGVREIWGDDAPPRLTVEYCARPLFPGNVTSVEAQSRLLDAAVVPR